MNVALRGAVRPSTSPPPGAFASRRTASPHARGQCRCPHPGRRCREGGLLARAGASGPPRTPSRAGGSGSRVLGPRAGSSGGGGSPVATASGSFPPGAGLPVLRCRLLPVQGPLGPLPRPGTLSAQPVLGLRHSRGPPGCPLSPQAPKRHLTARLPAPSPSQHSAPPKHHPAAPWKGLPLAIALLALRSL